MSKYLDPSQKIRKQKQKLPHWQQDQVWVFVTWRLADSLPQSKIIRWKEEKEAWLNIHPKPWDQATEAKYYKRFGETMDQWLDAGYGSCLLEKPTNSKIVADALLHFNNQRYQISNFVVMPNHVHVLFSPSEDYRLAEIIHSWKRFSARAINLQEKTSGALWQANYWDRLIRSKEHFEWTQKYITANPKNLQAGSFQLWSAGF